MGCHGLQQGNDREDSQTAFRRRGVTSIMCGLAACLLFASLSLPGCQEKQAEAGGSCSNGYDRSVFDQCVAACIKCEHGITTTCSTSCTLKSVRRSPESSR